VTKVIWKQITKKVEKGNDLETNQKTRKLEKSRKLVWKQTLEVG